MAAAAEKLLLAFFSLACVSLIAFFSSITTLTSSTTSTTPLPSPPLVRGSAAHLPSFAYYISGGRGDRRRILRLLLAVYHPRNRYLLHLSSDAPQCDRDDLANAVTASIPAARAFRNVDVVGRADADVYMGSSGLAAQLHAAAVMLKIDAGWDWFVALSARDYPLVSQDGMCDV